MRWPWQKEPAEPVFAPAVTPGAALDAAMRDQDGGMYRMLADLRAELQEQRALYDALAAKVVELEARMQKIERI